MGAVTSVVAGIAVAASAVALYRFVEKRTRAARRAFKNLQDRGVLEFELDRSTGIYRAK